MLGLSLAVGAVTAGFLVARSDHSEVLALRAAAYVLAGVMVLLLIGSTERPDSTDSTDSTETSAVSADRGDATPVGGFSAGTLAARVTTGGIPG